MSTLTAYLPQDRRHALAHGSPLPDRTHGSVLFADISGFTPLTEALRTALGPRRGAEELTHHLDAVYTALIAQVERYGGSVINFAGDAIQCWFDDAQGHAPARAVACAFALQTAMLAFTSVPLPAGAPLALSLKVAVATGPARRFVVGDPEIQRMDVLAGATVARTAAAEHLAERGTVVLDEATVQALGAALVIARWHTTSAYERFAVVTPTRDFLKQASAMRVERQPEPPLPPRALESWLHPLVYTRAQSAQGTLLTEFRPCVALFMRFVGIDYDADSAATQLDSFMRHAQTQARAYDGVLLNLIIGDKGSYAHIALGALNAHEDDARRAVKLALALRAQAAALGFLAPLQIGIAQGMMRVGEYGGPTRRTFSALGAEVNLAARLMQAAAPGEILTSARLHASLADSFTFVPRAPLQVKGQSAPVPVFIARGPRQQRALRLQEPEYALPMIGRVAELHTIAAKLELARQGHGQVVSIVAEAGMGKSRLVAEVIRLARAQGCAGYGGACQSDGVNTPYLVWRTLWQAFFELDATLPLAQQMRALENQVVAYAPERVSALPLLGAVLGLPLPENDFTRGLEPRYRKSALEALLVACLRAAPAAPAPVEGSVAGAPLLFVLEDLHWLDALSHDLLEEVARALSDLPVLMVLAYRPPQLPHLQAVRVEGLPHCTKIVLAELTAAESALAIRAKLAQLFPAAHAAPIPPALIARLTARAQGNPFYVEELLNYLRDRGLDPRDAGALDQIELPDSLRALILSRIDQLTEREKTTLKVASIVGRLFRATWLRGYYPALGELAQIKLNLEELHRLDITPLDAPEPELTYIFKHIITQEVAYESLAYATRAQLHEQLAHYLESTYPEAAVLDLLAHHYGRSANTAKQRDYFAKAGDAAQASYANAAALDYYERWLALPSSDAPAVRTQAITLHLKRGAVLELTGQWEGAEAAYRAALALADGSADGLWRARCQKALGTLYRLRGASDEALVWLAQALAEWEALGDQLGVSQVQIEQGVVLWRKGEYGSAQRQVAAGLTRAQSVGDSKGVALALNNLGNIAYDQGDYATARTLYAQGLALRRASHDKRGIAGSLGNLANVASDAGDYGAARALFAEGLTLFREIGDKWSISAALNNLGDVALMQGDYHGAQALIAECLALKQGMGDKRGVSMALNNLGIAAWHLGDLPAARAHYRDSLHLAYAIGDRLRGVYNLVGLACLAAPRDARAAARLSAAAEALLAALQGTVEPLIRALWDDARTTAQAALGPHAYAAECASGAQMTWEEAVALAEAG